MRIEPIQTEHDRLAISFSGGRTSAMMTRLLMIGRREGQEYVVTFANTGYEHPSTLDFVHECDTRWQLGVVWIEAEVDPAHGVGVRHRVVDYASASRDGRPFADYVRKYGLPGPAAPQCTSRMKLEPMQSYIRRGLGWRAGAYATAVGIRADEIDRVSARAMESGVVYPLADAGVTKAIVGAFMRAQGFDLSLPGDHYGNCVGCWKKSNRKLYTIAQDDERWFDIARMLEREGAGVKPHEAHPRTMYRGHRTVSDILSAARGMHPADRYADSGQMDLWDELLDLSGGCGESCDVYADETDEQRALAQGGE